MFWRFLGTLSLQCGISILLYICLNENKHPLQIYFSSSHRLVRNIEIIKEHFHDRKLIICKEMTKLNEQIIRNTPSKILEKIKNGNINIKGEFVLIIEGKYNANIKQIDKKIVNALVNISKKFSLTDSVKIVHKLTGLARKDLYSVALSKIKNK